MSRLRRIALTDRIFFVGTNLQRRVAPLSPPERTIVLNALDAERRRRNFYLYGFVVMPTHLHLLLDPAAQSLADIFRNFKSKTGLALGELRRTPGALWQPRYFDCICRHVRNVGEKLEYIHRNPVEAGLVERAEHWPWSSAGWYLNHSEPLIAIDALNLPADPGALLWPAPWRKP
jgi:REP element-mobilizing transposase RayT